MNSKKVKHFFSRNLKVVFLSIAIGLFACAISIFAFSSPGSNQPPNGTPTFWLLNGTSMYYSGGNVGIGTNSPGAKLQIVDSGATTAWIGTTDNRTNANLQIKGNAYIWAPSNTTMSSLGAVDTNFYNAGVSPTWAGALLEYFPSGYAGTINAIPNAPTGASAALFYGQNISSVSIGSNGSVPLYFFNANGTLMTIQPGGNVGIGTTVPVSGLHVISSNGGANSTWYNPANYAATIHQDSNSTGKYGLLVSDRWRSSENYLFTVDGRYTNGGGSVNEDTHTPYLIVRGDGNVGIGTESPAYKLDINIGAATDYPLQLTSSGGKYIRIGAQNTTWAHFDTNTSSGFYFYKYAAFAGGHGDLAENYKISGSALRGSVVSIDKTVVNATIASSKEQSKLLGVISTKPGAVMDVDGGFQIGYDTKLVYVNEKVPIALIGAVPTLVTSQNGPIDIGDAIGISDIPGFGAKMITAGRIVGNTMEKLDMSSCPIIPSIDSIVWPKDDGKNSLKPCFRLPDGTYVGKVMVAVNVSWYDPKADL